MSRWVAMATRGSGGDGYPAILCLVLSCATCICARQSPPTPPPPAATDIATPSSPSPTPPTLRQNCTSALADVSAVAGKNCTLSSAPTPYTGDVPVASWTIYVASSGSALLLLFAVLALLRYVKHARQQNAGKGGTRPSLSFQLSGSGRGSETTTVDGEMGQAASDQVAEDMIKKSKWSALPRPGIKDSLHRTQTQGSNNSHSLAGQAAESASLSSNPLYWTGRQDAVPNRRATTTTTSPAMSPAMSPAPAPASSHPGRFSIISFGRQVREVSSQLRYDWSMAPTNDTLPNSFDVDQTADWVTAMDHSLTMQDDMFTEPDDGSDAYDDVKLLRERQRQKQQEQEQQGDNTRSKKRGSGDSEAQMSGPLTSAPVSSVTITGDCSPDRDDVGGLRRPTNGDGRLSTSETSILPLIGPSSLVEPQPVPHDRASACISVTTTMIVDDSDSDGVEYSTMTSSPGTATRRHRSSSSQRAAVQPARPPLAAADRHTAEWTMPDTAGGSEGADDACYCLLEHRGSQGPVTMVVREEEEYCEMRKSAVPMTIRRAGADI